MTKNTKKRLRIIISMLFIIGIYLMNSPLYGLNNQIKTQRFGFFFKDNASISSFISPIEKEWGDLVSIIPMSIDSERWTFDSKEKITIVVVTFKRFQESEKIFLEIDRIHEVLKISNKQRK